MSKTLEARTVKARATGQWQAIHSALGLLPPWVFEKAPGKNMPCPAPGCGGKDRFFLFKDYAQTGGAYCRHCGAYPDGFAVVMWLGGFSFPEALAQVAEVLGVDEETARALAPRRAPNPAAPRPVDDSLPPALVRQRLQRVWSASVDAMSYEAAPMRCYLDRRGLSPVRVPPALRFHPALGYFDEDTGEWVGRFPAMVAMLIDSRDQPITLHRTYLQDDGTKAPVAKVRKLMSYPSDTTFRGCAVRLSDTTDPLDQSRGRGVLHVCEGIETGLAIRQSVGRPVWAATSAYLLEGLSVPARFNTVHIWADKDRSLAGERAAERLQARLRAAGLDAWIHLPDPPVPDGGKSIDWLDVLCQSGEGALRAASVPGTRAQRAA